MRKIQVLYQLPCKVEGIHDYDNPGVASQELFNTGIKILQYLQNLVKSFLVAEDAGWEYRRYKSGIIYLIPTNQGKEAIDNTLRAMGLICGENSEESPVYNIAEGGKSTNLVIQQPFSEKLSLYIECHGNAQRDKYILEKEAEYYFKGFTEATKVLSILGANGWRWTIEKSSLIFTPPEGISTFIGIKEALKKQGLNPKDFYIYKEEVTQ